MGTETQHDIEESSAADEFFEMSLDNICVAGLDGYFKRVNPSWTRTLGWTSAELKSKPVIEFVHPDDRAMVLAGRQRLKMGEEMGPMINRYRCKDGSYRWFEWRSVAHADRGLVYAVARDITEQKRSEERLRKAQAREETLQRQLIFADRMASVGTLAAGVAHEINNPLAYVTANIAMIIEDLRRLGTDPGEEPGKDAFATLIEMALDAQEGAERIQRIVGGLKTFSRAEEERLELTDVLSLIEMSVDMTFNEIRHRAQLVKEYGEIPLVEADEGRLGQVLINLLVNAAQAIPEGDAGGNEVRIVTSTDTAGRAIIEVHDTGVGIPESVMDRIFDPFFTTKPIGVGTGLGLSICHNIVSALGGEITATSEEGRGTTFRVALPAAAEGRVAIAASPAPEEDVREAACASVLVVDDEPTIGRTIGRILRDHKVTAVTTAKEGLALLEAGRDFHIIFSDIMMPEMSGMAFFEQLTERFPTAAERVVFISGGAFTPDAHAFLDRVPNELLDKPFDHDTIREFVQRYASGL